MSPCVSAAARAGDLLIDTVPEECCDDDRERDSSEHDPVRLEGHGQS